MENDIVEFQRLGAFHAASAMECVVKGGSAHLKMAVWHQNHAAHFYGSARRMLTKVINPHTTRTIKDGEGVMTRAEIIELIQNKYDRTPDHLLPNSGWDDGTGEIADTICARITELEAKLSTANAEIDWMRARIANAAIEVLKTNKDARVRQVEARANIALESMRNEVQVLREALEKIAWECDPEDPEWNQPEEGRNYIWKEARAALNPAKVKEEGND